MGGWSSTPSSGGSGFTGTYGSGTITADTPITFTQTWYNSGVTFTGYKVNVTDTTSNSASKLLDLQVGGVSKFTVGKNGSPILPNNVDIKLGNNLTFNGGASFGSMSWGGGGFLTLGDGYIAPLGFRADVQTVSTRTTTYSIGNKDYVVFVDATSAGFTVTLPSASSNPGQQVFIKKINAANTVTIATVSAQTIDGASTATLTAQWSKTTLIAYGGNWLVMN